MQTNWFYNERGDLECLFTYEGTTLRATIDRLDIEMYGYTQPKLSVLEDKAITKAKKDYHDSNSK